MKLLFLDLETTGLDPIYCGTVQIAGIIEETSKDFDPKKGKILDSFNYNCRPLVNVDLTVEYGKNNSKLIHIDRDIITEEALAVTGKTKDDLFSYPNPFEVKKQLIEKLNSHRDTKTREKYNLVGANPQFDRQRLDNWFRKLKYNYMFTMIAWWPFDVQQMAWQLKALGKIDPADLKITTLAEYFGIQFDAHDAMEDVKATREIFYILINAMKEIKQIK